MPGLLTGAGNVTLANNGTGVVSSYSVAVPANTQVGDLLLLFLMTGASAAGSRSFTASSPGGSWSKLGGSLGVTIEAGQIFYRVATAADLGQQVTTSFAGGTIGRWALTCARTEGVPADTMLNAQSSQAQAANPTSAALPVSPAAGSATVLHFLTMQVASPAQSPMPVSGGSGTSIATNDGYTPGIAQCTSTWLEQQQAAPGEVVSSVTVTYPGPSSRTVRVTVTLPLNTVTGGGVSSGTASPSAAANGTSPSSSSAASIVIANGTTVAAGTARPDITAPAAATSTGSVTTTTSAPGAATTVGVGKTSLSAAGSAASLGQPAVWVSAAGTAAATVTAVATSTAFGVAAATGWTATTVSALGSASGTGLAVVVLVAAGEAAAVGTATPETTQPVGQDYSFEVASIHTTWNATARTHPLSVTPTPARWEIRP